MFGPFTPLEMGSNKDLFLESLTENFSFSLNLTPSAERGDSNASFMEKLYRENSSESRSNLKVNQINESLKSQLQILDLYESNKSTRGSTSDSTAS